MEVLPMDEVLDVRTLRYALYARKSTTDETRQVRSIPDQIIECKNMATRLGLHIVGKPLTETESAKYPHQRPVFRQMLDDIKKGRYDAILCWNPDRLSRNMVEAGEIIDMIDNNIIKDLKFCTHPFSRDANGVMLLGLSFVLSKQYSDDLSQKVSRGVKHSLLEGKSPIPKHGYIRDSDGLYRPDGKNFELVKKAWEMRHRGDSLEKIAEHMNKEGYYREVKRSGKRIDMDKKILTDLFHDPFCYGVLIQAGQTVDLRKIYNFEAATTESVYNEVQQRSAGKLAAFNTRKTFYPFRGFIRCAFCDKNMVVAPSTGHKQYLYARCDTKGCTRKKKSIHIKVMLDFHAHAITKCHLCNCSCNTMTVKCISRNNFAILFSGLCKEITHSVSHNAFIPRS